MKKLILQEFISTDGFCADREKTTGFFDGTYNNIGNEITPHQEKLMESIDLILLGKETYKMFTNYWPDAGGEDSKLAEANLIDEIQLVVVPVAIGKGYSLFPEDFKLFHLALSDHKIFSNGVALLTYKPQEVLRPI